MFKELRNTGVNSGNGVFPKSSWGVKLALYWDGYPMTACRPNRILERGCAGEFQYACGCRGNDLA
jgi:hypothetical protein